MNGKPDLNGVWQAMNTANWDIQAHARRRRWRCGPARSSGPGEGSARARRDRFGPGRPRRGRRRRVPYTADGLKKKQENQENWLTRDPEIKCYLPGVPRATYMPFPFQIVQSDNAMFIAYEYAGAVRNIYLKDPGPAQIDSWMGNRSAAWEGDTFVVDVTGFNDQTLVRSRRQPPLRQA